MTAFSADDCSKAIQVEPAIRIKRRFFSLLGERCQFFIGISLAIQSSAIRKIGGIFFSGWKFRRGLHMATLSKVMGFDKNIYILSGKAFLLFILLSNVQTTNAQGINFPVGNPVGTSGAGNARTDADNYFLRNNVAGMTEIPGRKNASPSIA